MNTRLLYVLHHTTDEGTFTIREAIDINLDSVIQKSIKQYRRIIRYFDRFSHVAL